jgi:hypothetical protein
MLPKGLYECVSKDYMNAVPKGSYERSKGFFASKDHMNAASKDYMNVSPQRDYMNAAQKDSYERCPKGLYECRPII